LHQQAVKRLPVKNYSGFLAAAFFLVLAGLIFPKEAFVILPFFVLMSPRPIMSVLFVYCKFYLSKMLLFWRNTATALKKARR
jgi:hypothetical protein